MSKFKTLGFYAGFIGTFLILVLFILSQGEQIEKSKTITKNNSVQTEQAVQYNGSDDDASGSFLSGLLNNLKHPISIALLQIIVIAAFSRIIGRLFLKIGQPIVIGEIFAGIFLGPSLLGYLLPDVSAFLFPVSSLGNLQFLSQIGLILFMFIIGMELDRSLLKNKAHQAVLLSHASIIFPYFLGVSAAYFIYNDYAPDTTTFTSFALFLGISMSITAFPVLARIVQEKGMTKSHLGIMALTCAASDDITAWSLLAVVIAIVKAGTIFGALVTVVLSLLYLVFMLKVVQPLLNRISYVYSSHENLNKTIVAFIFIYLLTSAFVTEAIGIHALFGAFLAGVLLPDDHKFKSLLSEKIEDVSLTLFLPLFFVYTGLRTEIGLISTPAQWLICVILIIVAIAGKLGGSAIAARFVRMSWKESLSIGILMNTRGLMELVALNIGYDLGVLSPEIFSMLVIMAIATTFMTGPLLDLINKIFPEKEQATVKTIAAHKILIAFGRPEMGKTLLRIAHSLTGKSEDGSSIKALHVAPKADISIQDSMMIESAAFIPLLKLADELDIKVETVYKSTGKIKEEIIKECAKSGCDFLLLGAARSIFTEDKLGGKVKFFIKNNSTNLGIFIDNGMHQINKISIIIAEPADLRIIKYGIDMAKNSSASISVIDKDNICKEAPQLQELIRDLGAKINFTHNNSRDSFRNSDIIISSITYMKKNTQIFNEGAGTPSMLIIK